MCKPDAELGLHLASELLDEWRLELDHGAATNAGEVMVLGHRFGLKLLAGVFVGGIVRGDEAGFLEQGQRSIDGGEIDRRVLAPCPAVELIRVEMPAATLYDSEKQGALPGYPPAARAQEAVRLIKISVWSGIHGFWLTPLIANHLQQDYRSRRSKLGRDSVHIAWVFWASIVAK